MTGNTSTPRSSSNILCSYFARSNENIPFAPLLFITSAFAGISAETLATDVIANNATRNKRGRTIMSAVTTFFISILRIQIFVRTL